MNISFAFKNFDASDHLKKYARRRMEKLGRFFGKSAGLDVAAVEPLPATSPLLTAKNCIMTPHIAWATKEARQRLMNIAVDNLRCFLDGKPQNVVNP